jgi:segregation and condensation protein B
MDKEAIKPIIEALIFAADQALSIERMAGVLESVEKPLIREAVGELIEEYLERGGGIYIEKVAGGYQLRTQSSQAPWIKRLFKSQTQKLSKAAMEALSITAYKQPTTRGELEAIRGVDSGGVLKKLLDRRLIKIVGRKDTPGRPAVYGTTKEFLEAFELKDLSNLPTIKDTLLNEENEEDIIEDYDNSDNNIDPQDGGEEIDGSGETSEDNSDSGDSVEAQGGGDDPGRESDGGGQEDNRTRDEGGSS